VGREMSSGCECLRDGVDGWCNLNYFEFFPSLALLVTCYLVLIIIYAEKCSFPGVFEAVYGFFILLAVCAVLPYFSHFCRLAVWVEIEYIDARC
jgi:hypothetical protein